MRQVIKILLFMTVMGGLAGCFEIEQEFTLNPDGSGKVRIHSVFPATVFMGGLDVEPEEMVRRSAQSIMELSEGIDAWREVSFKLTDEGKMLFAGTAYFKDIAKLNISELPIVKPFFSRDEKGNLVLQLTTDGKAPPDVADVTEQLNLTESQIARRIQRALREIQQSKYVWGAFFEEFETSVVFHLPGEVKEQTNLTLNQDGSLSVFFEGDKMLEAMDALYADPAWLRKRVLAGRNLIDTQMINPDNLDLNQKMFSQNAPLRIVLSGPFKPLFDYQAEIAALKKTAADVEEAALKKTLTGRPVTIKNLQVGSVRLSYPLARDIGNLRMFFQEPSLSISLLADLSGPVVSVIGGTLEKALADNGTSLLPESGFQHKIHRYQLADDPNILAFDVYMNFPGPEVKALREISGTLSYTLATRLTKKDLGIKKFKAGSLGTQYEAEIISLTKDDRTDAYTIKLQLNLKKSVNFYDELGREIEYFRSFSPISGPPYTYEYSFDRALPVTGRIEIEIYEVLIEATTPFKLTNISLLGKPIKK